MPSFVKYLKDCVARLDFESDKTVSIVLLPVVVSPGELFLHQVLRLERLHRLDDMEIWNVLEFGMLCGVEVLHGDQDSFLEEMLVHGNSMSFWHIHDC